MYNRARPEDVVRRFVEEIRRAKDCIMTKERLSAISEEPASVHIMHMPAITIWASERYVRTVLAMRILGARALMF